MFAWGKVWRSIYTDGRPVPDDIAAGPYWYGYSVGKWEGDTLVLTTLALDERAWFDDWGVPISGEARVDERWQPLGPDKLQLTITVRDPITYSKPWTSSPIIFNRQVRSNRRKLFYRQWTRRPSTNISASLRLRRPVNKPSAEASDVRGLNGRMQIVPLPDGRGREIVLI